ncbi:MAG: ABC transporter ATP-binding protein [Candidatus Heimdallarchaeota archaeon]
MKENGHLLNVKNVVSGYGPVIIIRGVTIHIDHGEIVTIIGPNGSGKSTLLKTIFGIIRPMEGQITFQSWNIAGLRPDEVMTKGIGYVPQLGNIFRTLTVQENLEMGAYTRTADPEVHEDMKELYEMFPILKERKKVKAGNLSGGEAQMLAISRALMGRPRLLILDEPSASVAPALVDTILAKLVDIRDTGKTLLVVEQNARKSLAISDRGYVLVMGKKIHEGSGKDLLSEEIGQLFLGGETESEAEKGL